MKKIIFLLLLIGTGFFAEAQKLRLPKFKTKTYETYVKPHKVVPDQYYSGHTSGYDTPEKNVARRNYGHHKNDEYGEAKLDKTFDNLQDAKKREQELIDKFGGATRHGGTSGNAINAVRKPANQVKI